MKLTLDHGRDHGQGHGTVRYGQGHGTVRSRSWYGTVMVKVRPDHAIHEVSRFGTKRYGTKGHGHAPRKKLSLYI